MSAFLDEGSPPTVADLERTLGAAPAAAWKAIIAHVQTTYSPIAELWNFSGSKFGWSLRLKKKDRIVLYLIPERRRFLVGLVLGEKAVAAAAALKLPKPVVEAIAAAPRYAEGTGLRLTVTKKADLAPIEALIALKTAPPRK